MWRCLISTISALCLVTVFRTTPQLPTEKDELLWNTEVDGAWFAVGEFDVLVDEWERYLGCAARPDATISAAGTGIFSQLDYWAGVQRRVAAGEFHYVVPYPAERCLANQPEDPLTKAPSVRYGPGFSIMEKGLDKGPRRAKKAAPRI